MTDLFIAVGLVAVVVVVYLIYRMGVLPKKSLPFVIGGLVGILGITIFRERRMKGLRQDLERREKRLKEMEERL